MKKVSVIIPVYYNEESLQPLLIKLLEVEKNLQEKDLELEIIFVDDGSGDSSFEELKKIKQQRPENTRLIKLTRNFGAVHASKTGFQYVSGDCFIVLAADLQDPPELILEMVDKWLNGSKYVICVREERHDPVLSRIYAAFYYKVLHLLVRRDFPRGGFDLALMDKALLPYMQQSGKNINPSLFSYWLGFEPETIYYTRQERIFGKSRWTFSKKFTYFLDSILGFSFIPIRLISMIGIIVSLISFAYGLVIVVNTLLGKADMPGFPSIVALMSFLLGLVIIMLGVIGEYVWRIFDEINKRPESVIDEIY
ncbi:MAG: glycosyltransferase family 2 protein [Syntrophomonas sp.]